MTVLDLFSEPFASTGNLVGSGQKNLLGRPPLDPLQIVLREAVQNSVDAAAGVGKLGLKIRVRSLDEQQTAFLREQVLGARPQAGTSADELGRALDSGNVAVLEVCDFGTNGLGGPTRADLPAGDEDPDFVNFVRNVGAARDTEQGGGTYGYGKTSLYRFSTCSTILIDTLTLHRGQPERRLIGCHLGERHDGVDANGAPRAFTGRHWWGQFDQDGFVEPALDGAADQVASALGMPDRARQHLGTTIAIVAPEFDTTDPDAIRAEITETLLLNFWPRMTEDTPTARKLDITVEVDGVEQMVPRPEDFPPLDLYAEALAQIRAGGGTEIRCGNPRKHLGYCAISKGMRGDRASIALRETSQIPRQSAAIALMRPVELVVKYLPGDPFADARFEWGGVFICSQDAEVEKAFADAEPPAHDDWVPGNLEAGRAKTFVNVALRELREAARTYAAPIDAKHKSGGDGVSLARTAGRLGQMLGATEQAPKRPRSGTSRRRQQTKISQPVFDRLEWFNGSRQAVFTARIENDGRDPDLMVLAEAHVVADGAAIGFDSGQSDLEVGVTSMGLCGGDLACTGGMLPLGTRAGIIEICVHLGEDAAAGVKLRLETGA